MTKNMNLKKLLIKRCLIGFLSMLFIYPVAGQQADSAEFNTIVERILNNNPSFKQQREKINTARLKEQLIRTSYKPNIYSSAAVSKLYPVPAFDLSLPDPVSGDLVSRHMQMAPDISMDYSLKLNQLIYDFGKTANNLSLQQTYTDISEISADQLKDRLTITAAGYFYNLLYVQTAIQIKSDLIKALNQHLQVAEKKHATGSATQYEILATKVRITSTETQLSDLESSRQILIAHLNFLMGTTDSSLLVKNSLNIERPADITDSVFFYANDHRREMKIARKNVNAAEWSMKVTTSGSNPSLSFFGSTGFKNGYLADVNGLKFNYVAGLNLNVPLFDSQRKKVNKEMAASMLVDSKFAAENVSNQIRDEVTENIALMEVAYKKIAQYAIQLELAIEAYNHAQANYAAGTITNLDLLDASNILAESKLSLLKAEIDYRFYEIKYRSAIGADLQSVN